MLLREGYTTGMKSEEFYREVFITNTIHIVARGGFEAATTRAISGGRREVNANKLNEAHIYRVFGTKENLFAETFSMLDDEMVFTIKAALGAFDMCGDPRAECEIMFTKLWRFLLQNEEKCRYYTRYYHSVYIKDEIYKKHRNKYGPIIDALSPFFLDEADVWSLFYHVISIMLNFATRVYIGDLKDSEENRAHIFNVAYCSIVPYLK